LSLLRQGLEDENENEDEDEEAKRDRTLIDTRERAD
jgi:hypothetical protein